MRAVWEEYFEGKGIQKVLELGAGYLNANGQSFLSNRLPENVAMTFVDLNIAAVRDSKRRNYIHLDSVDLRSHFAEGSFSAVIGSCFIDNLAGSDLVKTLEGIHHILSKDGLFFHYSDLPPLIDTLITEYRNHPDIIFPWVTPDQYFQGLKIVPRSSCLEFLKRESTDQDVQYIKEYLSLTNQERAMLIIHLCEGGKVKPLSDLCMKFFNGVSSEVNNASYFDTKIDDSLKRTGFRILKSGTVTKQALVPIDSPIETNCVACFRGRIIKSKVALWDPNMIRITQAAHIIVAQKI
jgi:SAM-dependent methyltransferase